MKIALHSVSCTLLLACFVLLLGCRQAPPVQGFDSEAWKSDPEGCLGKRSQVWKNFEENKMRLLGYDEKYLKQLLGMPATKNLFEKGQKIYSYTISGSGKCPDKMPPLSLQLRLNVTGKVSEVVVVKEVAN